MGALAGGLGCFPLEHGPYHPHSDCRVPIKRHSQFDSIQYALTAPSQIQCSTSARCLPDASPKAISGRTSYFRVRLEFLLQPQVIRQLFNGGRFGPPLGITPASTCPWLDHPVSGLQQPTLLALLRLAFASAPPSRINLAFCRNSPVHSTKGTPSPFNGL